ncbi:histidine kinase [Undibacterium sp. TC4M20W]|uniref:hybrid sensor histidine kinase/response regulator n=1 Tax=Undibacterium sp. TC4M20W TaxID=3413052 RepID=UPI003BF2B12B
MSIPLRVLLVEDVSEDAELIVRELKRGGFAPDWLRVDNARAMQDALKQAKWDIVICDYSMPAFSGLKALELLKSLKLHIPFFITSGTIGENTALEVMRAGADDFFLKQNITRLPLAIERELRDSALRRKKMASETALREMQVRFHAFMNNAPTPAWIKDKDLRYVYVNTAQASFFGMAPAEMIGCDDFDLMSIGAAQTSRHHDEQVLASSASVSTQETIADEGLTARILNITRFPLGMDEGQPMVAGLAMDVTAEVHNQEHLKAANQRLQLLSGSIIEVQERERQHLARGLHDDVGQSLTALKIMLQAAQKADDEVRHTRLQEGVELVASILSQVRTLSLELRPPQLDNLGLVSALRWYVESKTSSDGLRGWFEYEGQISKLHPDIENTCFRIVQEAITNILRHAHASNIWVRLDKNESNLILRIRDDGKGFDVDQARENAVLGNSFGLLNMEERALLVGGTMDFISSPGAGVTIDVLLPFTPHIRGLT